LAAQFDGGAVTLALTQRHHTEQQSALCQLRHIGDFASGA
jgi:hypothetical protein